MTGAGGALGGEEGAQDGAAFGAGEAGRRGGVERVDEVAGGVGEAVFPAGGDVVEGAGLAVAAEGEGRGVGEAAVAAVDPDDAAGSCDFDAVVLGVIAGVDVQLGRVDDFEGAEAVAGELPGDDGGRVEDAAGHELHLADPGVGLFGLPHEVVGEGEFVVAVVEEHGAAAAEVGVEAPGPGGEGDVPGGGAEAGVAFDADGEGFADFAGVDQLFGARDGRVEEEVVIDAQGFAGDGCGGDHLVSLGKVEGHGLLDGDVLCGGERVEGDGVVKVMGQEDFDEVEVGQGEEFAVVGEDAVGGHVPLGGAALGGFFVSVADG